MIVVAISPTVEGRAALVRGIEEARLRALPLLLVEACRPDHDAGPDPLADDVARAQAELGADRVERRPLGEPSAFAEDLLRTADRVGATLILIGLRQRGSVGKLALGQGAQRILLEAPCPVIAVKAPAAGA